MAGVAGRSGRKKKPSTLVNEALDRVDQHLPELFQSLIDRATQGDREAAIYLIDRRLGKPKQHTDITSDDKQLGTGIITELMTLLGNKYQEYVGSYKELPQALSSNSRGLTEDVGSLPLIEEGHNANGTSEERLSTGVYEEAEAGSNGV